MVKMGSSWRRIIVALVVLYSIEAIPNGASSSSAFSSNTPNPSTSTSPLSSSSSTMPPTDGGSASAGKNKKPNIIMILADDMGWNDVSFHGSNQIPTPNIDALAYNGIILNNHYVSALCTPSRAALLTGKYPIHLGMQHSVILEPEPRGLPLTEKLLPQYLKDAGYKTHAIGKWHLGYYKREFTPTYRGFDSHFGYWNGLQDYHSHVVKATFEGYSGFDMRRNMSVAYDTAGKYSTDLFTEEAVRLIDTHDTRNPLFMYLSHLAVHSGNDDFPLQAPDEEITKFSHIEDPERRIYAAMVSKLDQSVGDVVSALRQRGMLENSIILFMSDNGAPTNGIHYNRGSNYPLRGIKDSPWEGGVRGVAAIWSPLIEKSARVSNQLIYVTDWLPTLLTAAGIGTKDLGVIDGINVWQSLTSNQNSPRYEVLLNIDDINNYAAIRRGDFKYIIGTTKSGKEWYGETGRPEFEDTEGVSPDYNPEMVLKSKTGVAISGMITARQVIELKSQRVRDSAARKVFRSKMLRIEDILHLRTQAEVKCNVKDQDKISCNPLDSPCLFNLKEDPCEMVNLAKTRPLVMQTLEDALLKYRGTVVPPSNIPTDARADPRYWNNTWVPWKDSDPWMLPPSDKGTSKIPTTTIALIAVIVGLVIIGVMICIALRYVARKNAEAPRSHRDFQKVEDSPNSGEVSRSLQNLRDLSIVKDNVNGRGIE